MREIDGGRRIGEVFRQLALSPKLLERWRGEWQARGEMAFAGIGRRGITPALNELQRAAELERRRKKTNQSTFTYAQVCTRRCS